MLSAFCSLATGQIRSDGQCLARHAASERHLLSSPLRAAPSPNPSTRNATRDDAHLSKHVAHIVASMRAMFGGTKNISPRSVPSPTVMAPQSHDNYRGASSHPACRAHQTAQPITPASGEVFSPLSTANPMVVG